MVPFGAVPSLCLKIGMETFQITSMEHKISQARLAHVKSKNKYFVYFVVLLESSHDNLCSFRALHHSVYIFFLFEDHDCCDKSTELLRDDQRDSSRTCKRFSAAALWQSTQVGKPFLIQHSAYLDPVHMYPNIF